MDLQRDMDPASGVVGLAASCVTLAALIVQVTSTLSTFRQKIKNSELAISSLISQLSALEASTSELGSILTERGSSICQRQGLAAALRQSLISCDDIIRCLHEQVSDTKTALETRPGLGPWEKTKFALNGDSLAPMREALRDQI